MTTKTRKSLAERRKMAEELITALGLALGVFVAMVGLVVFWLAWRAPASLDKLFAWVG